MPLIWVVPSIMNEFSRFVNQVVGKYRRLNVGITKKGYFRIDPGPVLKIVPLQE